MVTSLWIAVTSRSYAMCSRANPGASYTPRLFASMMRFSIWSLMPSPCRPPISFAASTRSTSDSKVRPLTATGHPSWNRTETSSGAMSTAGSQWATPMIGDTISMLTARLSNDFASCVAPQKLAHLGPTAQLGDELRIETRLVDAHVRVHQQRVPVEPLDVVALVRA